MASQEEAQAVQARNDPHTKVVVVAVDSSERSASINMKVNKRKVKLVALTRAVTLVQMTRETIKGMVVTGVVDAVVIAVVVVIAVAVVIVEVVVLSITETTKEAEAVAEVVVAGDVVISITHLLKKVHNHNNSRKKTITGNKIPSIL